MQLEQLLNEIQCRSKDRLPLEVLGEKARTVVKFAPPEQAQPEDICFLTDPAYREAVKASQAGVCVLKQSDFEAIYPEGAPLGKTIVLCADPYAFFAFASLSFFPVPSGNGMISKLAQIEEGAQVDPSATVEPFACIRRGVKVGARCVIKSGAFIDENVTIGEDSVIYPKVSVMHECVVGARVILHPGVVIGGDGFGFAPFKGEWIKIPQVGRVIVEDDVEIGCNTTIDRGALADTVVGRGTKLDNQIHLGHNVKIGEHTVGAACIGVAGSTTIGDHVIMGGAAMINGHINVPSKSIIGPGTVVTGWGKEPMMKTGFFPAMEGREFQKTSAMVSRLPAMRQQLRELTNTINTLQKQIES